MGSATSRSAESEERLPGEFQRASLPSPTSTPAFVDHQRVQNRDRGVFCVPAFGEIDFARAATRLRPWSAALRNSSCGASFPANEGFSDSSELMPMRLCGLFSNRRQLFRLESELDHSPSPSAEAKFARL